MKRIFVPALVCAPLALASCSPAGNDPGPGGVTIDEAEALDEAAEMVEAKRLPESALPGQLQADAPVELPPRAPASDPTQQPAPNQASGE